MKFKIGKRTGGMYEGRSDKDRTLTITPQVGTKWHDKGYAITGNYREPVPTGVYNVNYQYKIVGFNLPWEEALKLAQDLESGKTKAGTGPGNFGMWFNQYKMT